MGDLIQTIVAKYNYWIYITLMMIGLFALIGKNNLVKKIVGNYAKRFSESIENFEKLKVTLKAIHKTEASQVNEIHAQLVAAGKPTNASETDRNLFFALDNVMKKIGAELKR